MSLQLTSKAAENCLNLHCPKCNAIVMIGTQEEIGSLACAGVLPLCFNCNPGPADKIYSGLVDDERQAYLVTIEGLPFIFSWVWAGEEYGEMLMAQKTNWPTWFSLKTGINK